VEKRVKKNAFINVIVGYLVLAAGITYMTGSQKGGIPKHFTQEMTWINCRNPKCVPVWGWSESTTNYTFLEEDKDVQNT
jgi:hypothetical protein